MVFLDPTNDIAFKRLFGNQAKSEILISFLNSVLELPEGDKISSVIITDPYNLPDAQWLKTSIVDVRCTDQRNRQFIIELQVDVQNDYPARSQYYVALAITRQLAKKAEYKTIMPVIFVGILDFKLFESPDYHSTHQILNIKTHEHALQHMSFTFVELPKFTKSLEQLETIMDKWLFLLKNAAELDSIPKQFKTEHEFDDAFGLLNQGSMSKQELDAYDRAQDALRVAKSVLEAQFELGEEKGRKEGRREEAMIIAKQMLDDSMPIAKVAKLTGLSIDELKERSIAPKA